MIMSQGPTLSDCKGDQRIPLEVDFRVSLKNGRYPARWNINKDNGIVTVYLPEIWDNARDHSLFYEHDHPEQTYQNFLDELILSNLLERICLERAHEGIRLKGRSRCDPNCCIWRTTIMMLLPDCWDKVREMHPINKPDGTGHPNEQRRNSSQGPTLADKRGSERLHWLRERSRHIDNQIAELQDKKEIIEHEIQQIRKELK